MSFRKIIILFILLFGLASCALALDSIVVDPSVFEVTTKNLIENPKIYEGRNVVLRGEVIGDIMQRGEFAWINLHDQFNAVSVWIPWVLTREISHKGSYRYKGDTVEVRGIFRHSDPQLGSEFCIRADQLTVLEKGFFSAHPLTSAKINISLSMLAITLCLLFLRMFVVAKEKKESHK